MESLIVAIEGPKGVGKTAVATAVAQETNSELWAFPNYDTPTGRLIKDILLGHHESEKDKALILQSLMTVNRLEHANRLQPNKPGDLDRVVARYWQSAWVYGQIDGLPRDWLIAIERGTPRAHVNILLDAPIDVIRQRRVSRVKAQDIYEDRLGVEMELYRELWHQPPRRKGGEIWIIVDANRPLGRVVDEIARIVEASS